MPYCPFKLGLGESLVAKPIGLPGAGEDRRECERQRCQWWIPEVALNPMTRKPTPTGAGNCVAVMSYIGGQHSTNAAQSLVALQLKSMGLAFNDKGELVEEKGN